MRIVSFQEFTSLPAGTLFSKYEPCNFGELCIKGSTLFNSNGDDFFYKSLADAIESTGSDDFLKKLEDSRLNRTSLSMDFYTESRDGCFEYDQLYAAWERTDVIGLINRLIDTL